MGNYNEKVDCICASFVLPTTAIATVKYLSNEHSSIINIFWQLFPWVLDKKITKYFFYKVKHVPLRHAFCLTWQSRTFWAIFTSAEKIQQSFYLTINGKSWEKIFLIELYALERGFTVVIKVFSGTSRYMYNLLFHYNNPYRRPKT